MSMSRHCSSSQSPVTPIAGCGRFVGRVGALAVALGLGAAIANSPGVALADDEPGSASGSPSSSTESSAAKESSSSTTGPASKPASSNATGQAPNTTSPQSAADDDKSDVKGPDPDTKKDDRDSADSATETDAAATTDDGADTTLEQAAEENDIVTPMPAKRKDHPALTTAPDNTIATVEKRSVVTDRTDEPDKTDEPHEPDEPSEVRTLRTRDAGGSSTDPVDAAGSQSARVNMRALAATDEVVVPVTKAAPPLAPGAGGPIGFVTGLVSGLLSAVGLNQQASSGPVAPP
jgi:hypothetical protein